MVTPLVKARAIRGDSPEQLLERADVDDSEGAVAGTYTVRVSAYPSGEGYDQMVARMTDDSSTALDNRILGMFSTYEIIDGWDNQIRVPNLNTEPQRTLIFNLQSNGIGKAILSGEFQGDSQDK